MGPRIFAALGDRGRPTICWLNTAGETGPFVSPPSSIFGYPSRQEGGGLKSRGFSGKVTNGWIAFHQSSNYAELIGDRSRTFFVVRMLNVLFPERRRRGTALCLAVVQVFWLLLPFEKFSLSSRSTTDKPWLRFPPTISYLRLFTRENVSGSNVGIVVEYLRNTRKRKTNRDSINSNLETTVKKKNGYTRDTLIFPSSFP